MIPDSFNGHAYLFTGTWRAWQPRLTAFLARFARPDVMVFERGEENSWKIEAIRGVGAWAMLRPHSSPRKVAVLEAVERFTPEAADAFLKTLEEPPPSTVFFLFSQFPWSVPVTLRSRAIALHAPVLPPAATPAERRTFGRLVKMPAALRLAESARLAESGEALEEYLWGWLGALREAALGGESVAGLDEPTLILLMRRLLATLRLLRETNAQPRLLLDTFFLLW